MEVPLSRQQCGDNCEEACWDQNIAPEFQKPGQSQNKVVHVTFQALGKHLRIIMIITTTSSFQAVPVLSVFDVLCVISLPCRRVPNDLLHVKAASSNYLVIATALCHKLLLLWANILSVLDRFHCRPDLGKLWNNGGICCIWYRGCLLFFATNSLFQRTLIRHWHWLSVM